jgi:uncharacterized protein (DUF1015 family)
VTRIRPFQALRYDPSRVDPDRVLVPPYDVIAPSDRAAFYERDPHNAIRLELTRDVEDETSTDYSEIRKTLDAWRGEGVLVRDAEPTLYGLRQRFTAPDGGEHEREGFFALLHLEDYAKRIVRPHERTLAGPKADRLKLIRAVRANLSVVFLLYEDREQEVAQALAASFDPDAAQTYGDPQGAQHSVTPVTDRLRIDAVSQALSSRSLVIADGHHRYETALAYRDECRAAQPGAGPDAPHEWLLVYLANAYAPGTLLLPIHRLIRKAPVPTEAAWSERLAGWERTCVPVADAEAVPDLLAEHLAPLSNRHAFAVDDASGTLRVFSRPSSAGDNSVAELSVRVIHRDVIGGVFGLDESAVRDGAIDYPKSALQTARDVRQGRGTVALYLNPLTPEDVFRVTAAGEVMPQKSTFFYPKLPSGLVFRLLEEEG